jgi:putative heme-binding domain-containing protein
LDKLNVTDLVAALDSPGGWQRDMVMQLLLWKKDPAAKTALEKLAKDCPRDVTRLQALVTLDGLGLLRAETVLAALKDRSAVVRRHAVRCAELLKTTSPDVADAVLASATDPDVRVRIQVAVLLSGWAHPRAATALGRLIVANRSDPFVLAAAMSGLTRGTARAVIVATTKAATGPLPEALVRDMAATLVAVEPAESLGEIVRLFTALGPSGYTPNRLAAVAAVLDALDRRPGGWAAVGPTARSAMDPILDHARKVVDTAESAISQVLASIPLLGRNPTNRNADWQRLAGLLTVDRPPEVQFAALGALSHSADDAIPPLLIATWTGATPGLRSRLFDTLASRTGGLDRLLDALAQGTIPPGEIDTARRRRLLTDDRPAVRARAEKVFAATNPNRMTVIATYRSALIRPGDRIRGQAVFAKTCSPCHKLDGVGSAVGPDLAALADKSPRYLLGEILDPNRNVDSRFIEYRAVLKDGRTVAGVLAAETATGVTLRGQQGKDETVRRVDLDQLRSTGKSLMPEGLEADLPPAAMADLIAYLTATTSPPKKIPGNNPELITAGKGTLTLPAANAAIFGNSITFESEFHNIGFWQGANDHVAWSIRLDKAVTFDVYLDYACAQDSAGNSFILAGVKAPIEGKATSTGGWDKYQTRKIGTVSLPAGEGKITIRPNGPIRGALFDLRKVSFVPVGTIPK